VLTTVDVVVLCCVIIINNKPALVEPVDEAVLTDDPYEQPECQLTDPAEPRREVYVKLRLRPLLELCLSAAATNLAKMTDPAQARQLSTSDHVTTHTTCARALQLT
jgi:hypothetical protein